MSEEIIPPGKKLSSYQKMKKKYEAKIDELTKDIFVLVKNSSCLEAIEVKFKYNSIIEQDKIFWYSRPVESLEVGKALKAIKSIQGIDKIDNKP